MQLPSSDATWFVIRAKAGWEHLAAEELRAGGYETYLPMRRIRNFMRRQRLVTNQYRPVLEGYLFLAETRPIDWGLFRDDLRFRHVGRPLRDASGFAVGIPAKVVLAISVDETNGKFDDVGVHDKLAERFVKGREFILKDGPFASYRGIVDGVTSSELVQLLVHVFGRATTVTVDPNQLDEVA